jgi:hypothetical protein
MKIKELRKVEWAHNVPDLDNIADRVSDIPIEALDEGDSVDNYQSWGFAIDRKYYELCSHPDGHYFILLMMPGINDVKVYDAKSGDYLGTISSDGTLDDTMNLKDIYQDPGVEHAYDENRNIEFDVSKEKWEWLIEKYRGMIDWALK